MHSAAEEWEMSRRGSERGDVRRRARGKKGRVSEGTGWRWVKEEEEVGLTFEQDLSRIVLDAT